MMPCLTKFEGEKLSIWIVFLISIHLSLKQSIAIFLNIGYYLGKSNFNVWDKLYTKSILGKFCFDYVMTKQDFLIAVKHSSIAYIDFEISCSILHSKLFVIIRLDMRSAYANVQIYFIRFSIVWFISSLNCVYIYTFFYKIIRGELNLT